MKGIFRTLALIAIVSFVLGCGKDPVELVKTGILDMDKTVTVGDAFQAYKFFQNPRWNKVETEQKKIIVEFRGDVKFESYDGLKFQYFTIDKDIIQKAKSAVKNFTFLTQFAINKDGKAFEIQYAGYEVLNKNGETKDIKADDLEPVKNIFKNAADPETLILIHGFGYAIIQQEEEAKKQAQEKIYDGVRKEALKASENLWIQNILACDDGLFIFNDRYLHQIKNVTFRISNLEKIKPAELSQADILNNVNKSNVEWKASAELIPKAVRGSFIGFQDGRYTWEKWSDNSEGNFSLSINIIKDDGEWKFEPKESHKFKQSIDCAGIAKVQMPSNL